MVGIGIMIRWVVDRNEHWSLAILVQMLTEDRLQCLGYLQSYRDLTILVIAVGVVRKYESPNASAEVAIESSCCGIHDPYFRANRRLQGSEPKGVGRVMIITVRARPKDMETRHERPGWGGAMQEFGWPPELALHLPDQTSLRTLCGEEFEVRLRYSHCFGVAGGAPLIVKLEIFTAKGRALTDQIHPEQV